MVDGSALARATCGAALELLFPARCAGCGVWGSACCANCRGVFGAPRRCAPPVSSQEVPAFALARYSGLARELVLACKERGRRDLTAPLGAELAAAVPRLPGGLTDASGTCWLVPAPSRRPSARRRGGSHMYAIARQCARVLRESGVSAAVAPALRLSRGARDSAGLAHARRPQNLAGRLTAVQAALPPVASPILLLDDVVTTGTTTAASVRALRAEGSTVACALVLTTAC